MNGPDGIAVCQCTHFPQLLVRERKKKTDIRTEDKQNQKEVLQCLSPVLSNSVLTRCCSATVLSTENICNSKDS